MLQAVINWAVPFVLGGLISIILAQWKRYTKRKKPKQRAFAAFCVLKLYASTKSTPSAAIALYTQKKP